MSKARKSSNVGCFRETAPISTEAHPTEKTRRSSGFDDAETRRASLAALDNNSTGEYVTHDLTAILLKS